MIRFSKIFFSNESLHTVFRQFLPQPCLLVSYPLLLQTLIVLSTMAKLLYLSRAQLVITLFHFDEKIQTFYLNATCSSNLCIGFCERQNIVMNMVYCLEGEIQINKKVSHSLKIGSSYLPIPMSRRQSAAVKLGNES